MPGGRTVGHSGRVYDSHVSAVARAVAGSLLHLPAEVNCTTIGGGICATGAAAVAEIITLLAGAGTYPAIDAGRVEMNAMKVLNLLITSLLMELLMALCIDRRRGHYPTSHKHVASLH